MVSVAVGSEEKWFALKSGGGCRHVGPLAAWGTGLASIEAPWQKHKTLVRAEHVWSLTLCQHKARGQSDKWNIDLGHREREDQSTLFFLDFFFFTLLLLLLPIQRNPPLLLTTATTKTPASVGLIRDAAQLSPRRSLLRQQKKKRGKSENSFLFLTHTLFFAQRPTVPVRSKWTTSSFVFLLLLLLSPFIFFLSFDFSFALFSFLIIPSTPCLPSSLVQ